MLTFAAKTAWIDGYRFTLVIGAVVIASFAIVVFRWLPDKSEDSVDEVVHG